MSTKDYLSLFLVGVALGFFSSIIGVPTEALTLINTLSLLFFLSFLGYVLFKADDRNPIIHASAVLLMNKMLKDKLLNSMAPGIVVLTTLALTFSVVVLHLASLALSVAMYQHLYSHYKTEIKFLL